MIPRIALTLALASSVALTAGQETENDFRLGVVTGITITAGLAAIAKGFHSNSPDTTSAGIGLLTGLGCARLEHYAQKVLSDNDNKMLPLIMPITWLAERTMRAQASLDAGTAARVSGYRTFDVKTIPGRLSSWLSYSVYYAARNIDNK